MYDHSFVHCVFAISQLYIITVVVAAGAFVVDVVNI